MSFSRRRLFGAFFKPLKSGGEKARRVLQGTTSGNIPPATGTPNQVAIIQGKYCLAYHGSYCSTCYERCPVPGAIEFDDAIPRVVLETCTGCGVCHEVCPAPENAILVAERRPGLGA